MRRVSRPTTQSAVLPLPMGGLDTVTPLSAMPADRSPLVSNLIPGETGLDVRPGYLEHCTGLTGGPVGEVRSMLSFRGAAAANAGDKQFGVTASGIWDTTTSAAGPTQTFAFGSSASAAGWGISAVMVTPSGGHYLALTDEENGLHYRPESTGTWAAVTQGADPATQISGVDPGDLVFVHVFKKRLWFVERDSTRGWYLDTGSVFGTATKFDFGAQFPSGGVLVGLFSLSYDGGAGMDDSLVAISSGGDIVLYQGTDPSDPDAFGMKGQWKAPPPPAGRRVALDMGGDLWVLTRTGIKALSKLISGAVSTDNTQDATARIANRFASLMLERGGVLGWSMVPHPAVNAILVTVPTLSGETPLQFAFSLSTGGWFPWKGLPVVSACTYAGELYFGTGDGKVCVQRGYVDGVTLADSSVWSSVAWSVLPAFQNLGNGRNKQLQLIRPTVLAGVANASVAASARYNYDASEPAAVSGNGGGGAGAWDSAVWDTAVWGDDGTVSQPVLGATGMGRSVSVALQGNAISKTTLVEVEVSFTVGGLL